MLAKVTNNKDPDGMGRVKVSYPALGKETEGNWARIASPSAGKERGLLMLPQVGDKVLVSCITACGACRFCADGRENLCARRHSRIQIKKTPYPARIF